MVSSSTTAAVITRSAPTPRLSVAKVRQRRWLFFFHQLAAKRRRRRVPNYRRHLLRSRHLRRRGDHLREQRGVRAPPHDDDDDDYEDSSYSLSLNARVCVSRLLFLWKNLSLNSVFLTKVLLDDESLESRGMSSPCSSLYLSTHSLSLLLYHLWIKCSA